MSIPPNLPAPPDGSGLSYILHPDDSPIVCPHCLLPMAYRVLLDVYVCPSLGVRAEDFQAGILAGRVLSHTFTHFGIYQFGAN